MSINCEQLIDAIADYLAGELDAETQRDFPRHLAGCLSCQAYLDSYRRTLRLVRLAADDRLMQDERG